MLDAGRKIMMAIALSLRSDGDCMSVGQLVATLFPERVHGVWKFNGFWIDPDDWEGFELAFGDQMSVRGDGTIVLASAIAARTLAEQMQLDWGEFGYARNQFAPPIVEAACIDGAYWIVVSHEAGLVDGLHALPGVRIQPASVEELGYAGIGRRVVPDTANSGH